MDREHVFNNPRRVNIPRINPFVHKRGWLYNARDVCLILSWISIAVFTIAETAPSVFVLYLVFGCIGIFAAKRLDYTAEQIFIVVYGASTIAAIALYVYYSYKYGVPYLLGGSDDLHYEIMGEKFANSFNLLEYGAIRGSIVLEWHNSVGYVYLIGVLFKIADLLGGIHTMVPRLFNVLCLGLLSVGIYVICLRLLLQRQTAVAAALFAGLLPLMVLTSIQTLRDTFIAVLIVWIVALWTSPKSRPFKQSMSVTLIFTCFAIAILFEFRRAQALVAVLITLIGLSVSRGVKKRSIWVGASIALVLSAMLFFTFSNEIGSDAAFFLQLSEEYSIYRVEATGGGLSSIVFTTPPPLGWVLRAGYALISPLPVFSRELDELWTSAGTALQFLFIPFLFLGVCSSFHNKSSWTVLGAFVFLFIGMSMFTFQIRHIVQYLPFAVVLVAIGYEKHRSMRDSVFAFMGLLGITSAVIYVSLK